MTTQTPSQTSPALSPSDQLALRSIFPHGKLAFEGISLLIDGMQNHQKDARFLACVEQIRLFDGHPVEQLDEDHQHLLEKSLENVLKLSSTPDISGFAQSSRVDFMAAELALSRLSLLRNGQPDPRLLLETSPTAEKALNYLRQELTHQRPIIRLVIGDMGEGKSTFATALEQHCEIHKVIFERTTIPRGQHFDVFSMARGIIIPVGPMATALQQIALATLVDPETPLIKTSRNAFTVQPLANFMRDLIDFTQRHADTYADEQSAGALAEKAVGAIASWYSAPSRSRMVGIREFHGQIDPSFRFTGMPTKSEVVAVMKDFLHFYRAVQVHPVWLYDEFESITQLRANQLDIALGFFRDVIDLVNETKGGSILLFSTSDGQRAIRKYGALDDRLKAADSWSLTAPTWNVQRFSAWDADKFLEALLSLYQQAREIDPLFAGAVTDLADVYREFANDQRFRTTVSDTGILPRERIKAIVSLLDSAVDGEDAVRQRFAALWEAPSEPESSESFLSSPQESQPGNEADQWPLETAFMSILSAENVQRSSKAGSEVVSSEEQELGSIDISDIELPPANNDDVQLPYLDTPVYVAPGTEVGREADGEIDQASIKKASKGLITTREALDPELGGPRDGMTEIGRQRQEDRDIEAAAVCGWVTDSNPLLSKPKDKPLDQFILISNSSAHIGARVAAYRDVGGLIDNIDKRLESVGVSTAIQVLKSDKGADLLKLHDLSQEIIQVLPSQAVRVMAASGNDIGVAKKKLADEDKDLIEKGRKKLGSAAYLDVVPYKARFAQCHEALDINPAENIQVLRKFVYTIAAHKGVLPPDEWTDGFVLKLAFDHFGHQPPSSRNGIAFIQQRGGLLSMFEKRRTLAVLPLTECVTN